MGTIYSLSTTDKKCLLQTEKTCRHSVTNNTCSSEGYIPGLTPGGGTTENILTHVVQVFSHWWVGRAVRRAPAERFYVSSNLIPTSAE